MTLQPISYRGRYVAAATPERFVLADDFERRRPRDPETTFVMYMCLYAREVLTGGLPGPYTARAARRFAQAALIPEELLERQDLDVDQAAYGLQVPVDELRDALRAALASAAWARPIAGQR
jgi:hypothetical protein